MGYQGFVQTDAIRKLPEQPPPKPDDVSQAILKRKASPNKLMVDDATNDDNSVCSMNTATMEALSLFRG